MAAPSPILGETDVARCIEEFAPNLRYTIVRTVPHALRHLIEVEDVFQEVRLRIISAGMAIRSDGVKDLLELITHRVVVNQVVALLAVKRGGGARRIDCGATTFDRLAALARTPTTSPSGALSRKENHDRLYAVLAGDVLNSREWELVHGRMEGRSHKQIARQLKTTENTLGVTLHRAHSKLREALGSEGSFFSDGT